MSSSDLSTADVDDVGEALREGRPLRAAARYRVLYAEASLNFTPIVLDDPVPLGRQILDAAGVRPREDYGLYALLQSGDFEDVRLDEAFDLRGKGAERFVAFKTDRVFKFTLDERQIAWGLPTVAEAVLRELAGIDGELAVFLEVRGGTDRVITPGEAVDLTQPGVERFITAPRPNPDAFKVIVSYNGVNRPLEVTRGEGLQSVLSRALAVFGNPAGDPLGLFTDGGELDLGQTVAQANIKPGDRLLLRPRTVRGG